MCTLYGLNAKSRITGVADLGHNKTATLKIITSHFRIVEFVTHADFHGNAIVTQIHTRHLILTL
jgi:hypothetical protein